MYRYCTMGMGHVLGRPYSEDCSTAARSAEALLNTAELAVRAWKGIFRGWENRSYIRTSNTDN